MRETLVQHIRHLIQEHRIHTVRVTLTDNTNITRSRYVPAKAFLQSISEQGINYPSALFSMDTSAKLVTGAGDGYEGGYPSWLLQPDLSTFVVLPWVSGTARVIADIVRPGGEPIPVSPRQVLKNLLKQLNDVGLTMKGAFEFEFYVFRQQGDSLEPSWQGFNCFSDVNQAQVGDIFTAIIQGLEGIGAGPEVANTEYGPGQFEITNSPFNGVAAADMAIYYRSSIKEILTQKGYTATFMGKPKCDASGSGGHFHFSLYNALGQNVFHDPEAKDGLSDLCRWAIGGQLRHARAICGVVNSTVNSYKRLQPYSFAPINASWGHEHRCAMIRVPYVRGENTRLENRLPAADTNPYLAAAAILAASLDGIKNQIEPPACSDGLNPYEQTDLVKLPATLPEALEELQRDQVICAYLGREFIRHYVALRMSEWQRYQRHISNWEIKEYFELF
ncbi:glutamine synthetase family protein [Desulforamulus putei]|uniref:glutamine synthetase n=1 Tax=Desulforamulus putei DSM 12395 TaxID=1121429 RepID=A0A1M4XLG0_9FIRM|nr:glutamine synthetase family protein [Desulforamulus putei]SHE94073.1 glutamine synthetase [Desulforamulus putei DSM 12395]